MNEEDVPGFDKNEVQVASTAGECIVTAWNEKAQDFQTTKRAHIWHWITEGGKMTANQRCGTCGLVVTNGK